MLGDFLTWIQPKHIFEDNDLIRLDCNMTDVFTLGARGKNSKTLYPFKLNTRLGSFR